MEPKEKYIIDEWIGRDVPDHWRVASKKPDNEIRFIIRVTQEDIRRICEIKNMFPNDTIDDIYSSALEMYIDKLGGD